MNIARWTMGLISGTLIALPLAGNLAAKDNPVFRAGAATSNITPELGVRLDGPSAQKGPAKSVHDELHARCLVLDDGTERVAFVVCDVTMIGQQVIDQANQRIALRSKLPADRVVISATHTHSTCGISISWPHGSPMPCSVQSAISLRRKSDGVACQSRNTSIIGGGSSKTANGGRIRLESKGRKSS